MSAAEDLDTACFLLEKMLELHQADKQSVQATLRLIKGALAELGDKPAEDKDEEPASEDAAAARGREEDWPDCVKEKKSSASAALDHAMGLTQAHSEGTAFANGIQVLGVLGVVGHVEK